MVRLDIAPACATWYQPGHKGEATMNEDAREILARALQRGESRAAATPRIDYAESSKVFRKQKAALTRAVNSGDRDKVILTCRTAVQEWGQAPFHGAWPDDWSRWQRALDDVLPWGQQVDLQDLR